MFRQQRDAANSNMSLAAIGKREELDRKTIGFLAWTGILRSYHALNRTRVPRTPIFSARTDLHRPFTEELELLLLESCLVQPPDNKVKLAPHHPSRLFSKGACHSVDCKKQKGRGGWATQTSKRDDEVVLLRPGNVNTEARHQWLCIHPAFFCPCFQTGG